MRWFWGLLIVVIGIIFLGQNFNFWGSQRIDQIVLFWPLILVLFGIALMTRKSKFNWLIILASFIVAASFIYFAIFNASSALKLNNNIFNRQTQTYNFSADLPDEAKIAKITIDTGAVNLQLKENDNFLINGNLISSYSQPILSTATNDEIAVVNLKNDKINSLVLGRNSFNIEITNKIPVDLVINAGASSLNLDLSNINLNSLDLNTGATSMDIQLGKVTNGANLNVDTGASSLNIIAPKNLGVKVIFKTGLTSKSLSGYKKIDNQTFESPDYNLSTDKITLNISAGASSIDIRTK